MHISLDSALGRQRRLNSVGDSVLQIAPNAAAAYSLRSLTGGDPKVVRVRRASDNGERDFTSIEIATGEMVNWVNKQVIAPLDIQALEADGRTGDFLIAKAAYSLRSLGTRQATLAATEDTVARANGKFVVQVRRSSDDALKSFTADEVTDGTLLAFVNEDVTIYQSDYSAGVNGWSDNSTITLAGNQDGVSDGLTSKDNVLKLTKAADSQGYMTRDQGVVAGLTYTVSGSFLAPASNATVDGMLIKDGLAGSSLSDYPSGYLISDGAWKDFSFSYTAAVDGNQRINFGTSSLGNVPNVSSTGSTGDIVYIADLKFVETTSNGFVKVWYDQSVTTEQGNVATGHHAVQTTPANQPLIVSAGALVADNGIGGIDFDGSTSSRSLVAPSVSGLTGSLSLFSTSVYDSGTGNPVSLSSITDSAKYFATKEGGSTSVANPRNSTNVSVSASVSGSDRLTFAVTTGETSFGVGALGGTLVTSTSDYGSDFGSGNLDQIAIGLLRTVSPTGFLNGRIREILVYTSDQTANRGAIEANIGEAYSITGIPAYDDEVDGFVETWYDQSGNGEDAVQATAGSQPKIVNAGSLVVDSAGLPEIDFDGSNDYLTASSYSRSGEDLPLTMISVFNQDVAGIDYVVALNQTNNNAFDRILLRTDSFDYGRRATDNTAKAGSGSDPDADTKYLFTAINSGTTSSGFVDGSSIFSGVDTNVGTQALNQINIGLNTGDSSANNPFDGKMQEIIIYETDQSANRLALEANIMTNYGIS